MHVNGHNIICPLKESPTHFLKGKYQIHFYRNNNATLQPSPKKAKP